MHNVFEWVSLKVIYRDRNEPDNLVRIGICYHDMIEWNGIVWFGLDWDDQDNST